MRLNTTSQGAVAPDPGGEVVIGSLCTGYAGLDMAVLAAFGGGRIAWVADPDPHIRLLLDRRLPRVPNLGDITEIDWSEVDPVTVITAGFPCQDISGAGKGAGIRKGAHSGVWTHVHRAVRHLRPALLVVENVAALRWRNGGLHHVLGDLAEIGYDARWRCLRASEVGAAHRRERIFLLAYPRGARFLSYVADPLGQGLAQPDAAPTATGRTVDREPAGCRRPPATDPAGSRRQLQRPQRRQPPRRDVADRHGPGAAAHPGRFQPQRRGGHRSLADSAGPAPATPDQRQRHGHAVVHRGAVAADPQSQRHRNRRAATRPGIPATTVRASAAAVPDPSRHRGHQGQSEPARLQGRPDAVLGRRPAAATEPETHPHPHAFPPGGDHPPASDTADAHERPHRRQPNPAHGEATHTTPMAGDRISWGEYEPAIRRWQTVTGHPVPHPTESGRNGTLRLAPTFVEWLMGLEPGWVTDIDIPRAAQLRALGNGVVPQQGLVAIASLLADLPTPARNNDSADRAKEAQSA
ncbi:DNA cytosine methyltransferase [Crossiella sp. SN42]|uniref:DNA cytosine methyltransferase n=1 Tax=Crossiella sp. SN42 TaxID=2944808 RepID=UPI00207C25B5|nr:DNA cytosine methyltransferase [Crossiella sp. SN42]MCO1575911.1 DNA cytosine methyltransferase [Crossiella sp. SN42]